MPIKYTPLRKDGPVSFAIRGLSKVGKTHNANLFNGPEKTFVMDTHPANSTLQTCTKLGNIKVRRVASIDEIETFTSEVLSEKPERPCSLVLDSASSLVEFAQSKYKAKHGKMPFEYTWGEVFDYIREWLRRVNEANVDLILTVKMKRSYSENEKGESVWNGGWEPQEWKDLDYEVDFSVNLEQGLKIKESVYFPYIVFARVATKEGQSWSRFNSPTQTKPFIVGALTRENVMKQILEPYEGTTKDILREYYSSLRSSPSPIDKRFCRDIKKLFTEIKEPLSDDFVVPTESNVRSGKYSESIGGKEIESKEEEETV